MLWKLSNCIRLKTCGYNSRRIRAVHTISHDDITQVLLRTYIWRAGLLATIECPCYFCISIHWCLRFYSFYHSAGCKDYWSYLFIEWRTDAHLIQRCRQRISILQLPLSWNHGPWCWEQNVLLHSLLGVSFTHMKGITWSWEMHYNLICDCLSILCLLHVGTLSSENPLIFERLIIVQSATYVQLYLTDCRIAWQPFNTSRFTCIIRSNVMIFNTLKDIRVQGIWFHFIVNW